MNPAAVLNILVKANTTQANLGLAKVNAQAKMTATHFETVDRGSGRVGKSLAAVGKTAAFVGATGGFAVLGVGIKKAIDEGIEAQKTMKQTEAVLKSTGGAAGVSAKQISDLANRLSLMAGIDDELIQKGENLLLTFRNVRDEAGKNNDVFSQATKLALDMSVAMDQSLKSSVIQIGKALNDPIQGLTALQRVGVTFSQSQKDIIKGLVESGDRMKAQKIILAELRKEFGGSARANANAMDRLKVAVNNLFETVGTALLPTVNKAAAALARFAVQMNTGRGVGGRFAARVSEIAGVLKDLWPVLRTTIEVMGAFAGITRTVAGVRIPGFIQVLLRLANPILRMIDLIKLLSAVARALAGFFSRLAHAGASLANTVVDTLAPAFRTLRGVVNTALTPLRKAYDLLHDIAGIAGGVVGKIGSIGKSLNPFGKGQPLEDFFGQFAPFAGLGAVGSLGKGPISLGKVRSLSLAMGLSGGLGPGQGFRPGDDGWHGLGRALDNSGPPAKMMAFAQMMAAKYGGKLLELIYTPLGFGIKNGKRVPLSFWGPATNADHFDHVHVALQKGGMAVPGHGSGDKVPVSAMVEPGERLFVLNRNAVPAYEALNGMFPRFQGGGVAAAASRRTTNYHRFWKWATGHGYQPGSGMGQYAAAIARWPARYWKPTRGGDIYYDWFEKWKDRDRYQRGGPVPGFAAGGTVTPEYRRLIGIASNRYGIPARVLAGLIQVESGWNPNAVSPVGAFGLTQFMPGTAAGYGVARGSGHHAVATQILGAAHYLKDLGFARNSRFALGAYNGGPGNPQYGYANAVLAASSGYRGIGRMARKAKHHAKKMAKKAPRVNKPPRFFGIGRGGVLDAFITSISNGLNMKAALAALTPSTLDDIAAAQDAVSAWESWLGVAQKNHDMPAITTIAENLASARSTLAGLTTPTTDTADQMQAAVEAHTQAVAEQTAQMRRNEQLILAQGPALTSALVQMVNGGIGGNAGLGRQFPSSIGLGGLARA